GGARRSVGPRGGDRGGKSISGATLTAGALPARSLAGPEPALARLELLQRLPECLAAEVRPQLVAEDQLRVRALPQQVVGDPQLAAGPDQNVRVVHLGRVEQGAEVVLSPALKELGGVEDLRAPAVVEGDEEPDPIVVRCQLLGPLHAFHQLRVDFVATPDETHPNALV